LAEVAFSEAAEEISAVLSEAGEVTIGTLKTI
jgi:hypothetical protein